MILNESNYNMTPHYNLLLLSLLFKAVQLGFTYL